MVLCGFPIVLCCLPMVLCHGAAGRRSPAQLCGLPYGAVPRRCHQALTSAALRASRWCSFRSGFFAAASAHSRQRSSASSVPQSKRCGIHFRAAVSGAAAVSPAQRQSLRRSGKFFRAAQSGSIICHPAAAPRPGGSHIRPRCARLLAKPEIFSAR